MTYEELGLERALEVIESRWGLAPQLSNSRPVFVLSAGWRSGSTLLQRLVASTGEIYMWGEPYDLSGLIQRLAESLLPFDRTWPSDWYILDGTTPRADAWIANAYPHPRHLLDAHRALLTRLFAEPAAEAGFDRWGIKEVRLTGEHARYLQCLFPDAAFLIIHRDPYEAYASYRAMVRDRTGSPGVDWWWDWPNTQIDSAARFGQAWHSLAGSLIQSAPRLGALVVPYEELIRGEGLDEIDALLGAPVDRSVLEVRIAGRDRTGAADASARVDNLTLEDVADLRAQVEPLATELGYRAPHRAGTLTGGLLRLKRRAGAARRILHSAAENATRARRRVTGKDALEARQRKRRRKSRRDRTDPHAQWENIRASLATRPTEMTRFVYFPGGGGNPYPTVMCTRFPRHGFWAGRLRTLEGLEEMGDGAVLNLHWFRASPDGENDIAVARENAAALADPIRRFVSKGGKLLWTLHEPLPHDTDLADIEVELRTELAALATGIHVLHPSTIDAAASLYPIDRQKSIVVEHPLFTGFYPDFQSRTDARAAIGIPDDAIVLLAFGTVRRYKGTDRLVRALPTIRKETGRDVRVFVAGWTPTTPYLPELRELIEATEGAVLARQGPPDQYVHTLFRAADIAVQPYWAFHNSGVSFLSITFDCPIIAPRAPVSEDLQASGMVRLFDPPSDEDLTRVVVRSIEDGFHGPRRAAPEFLEYHDPARLSDDFARKIRTLLDGESN